MDILNSNYWESRYRENSTGWDIGHVSTPLKEYFDQMNDKNKKMLIPGAGNAYEAQYLWNQGFKNIHICDWAESPLKQLKQEIPDIPDSHLINTDFFKLDDQYDLIVEQTFFCALDPKLRPDYCSKMHDLLVDGGKLVGLLFDFPDKLDGPPFGGKKEDYLKHFAPYFKVKTFEKSYNSILPRADQEWFIILEKK